VRTRTLSGVAIVVVSLVPIILGGPVFAILMIAIGALAFREYLNLAARLEAGGHAPRTGYGVVVACGLLALMGGDQVAVVSLAMLAVATPFVAVILRDQPGTAFSDWAIATAGSLYLGLPIYAAVALRRSSGEVDAAWLDELAAGAAVAWESAPRGLAWVLLVVLATWLGDTSAYLIGRAFGRRPLAPQVSPKKTVEGALGGLVASGVAGAIAGVWFGLGILPVLGFGLGLALGGVGQLADLSKSVLKRQVGAKDSGSLIPGHGGMLDRIDALLYAFPTGWLLATLIDQPRW
jgi:phosphatidate cytidylyltransferase